MDQLCGICAVALSATLVLSPAVAQSGTSSAPPAKKRATPQTATVHLQGDQRILHALNRFTFGPRPGDLEAVRAMGLESWFEQQLHPAKLDQSELQTHLDQFPILQMSPQELLTEFPSDAILRQALDGKAKIPDSDLLRPVYQNQMDRIESRRQQEKQPESSGAAPLLVSSPTSATMQSSATEMSPAKTASNPELPAFDEAQIPIILALLPAQRVSHLLAMTQPEFDSFRKALKPAQCNALTDGFSPRDKQTVAALENPQRVVVEELTEQRLARDIYSSAQLQEVMTDFWLNHFNVFLHKNDEMPYYLTSYERDVIRPLALGNFEDLLEATAHSPAMLLYLDNATSIGPDSLAAEHQKNAASRNPKAAQKTPAGLNENYARELMELHTLGVNGGYSQADVTQVARILTGWTVEQPQHGGEFKFDPTRHEPGPKFVLGKTFTENGEQEGRQLLHLLAMRPATANFICRKLAVRFVGDDPPPALVSRMSKAYLSNHGDISAVLLTLFHSPELWSDIAWRSKVKTPLDFVVSAARASSTTGDNLIPLANALREMGMPLYGAVPPTGYSAQSSAWISAGALVTRMNFALSLASNKLPGLKEQWQPQPNASASAATADRTTEELRLESLLVAGGLSTKTRSNLLDPQLNPLPPKAPLEKQDQVLAGLLLGSPEFQRR